MSNATFALSDVYQIVGFIGIVITILTGIIQRDRALQKQICEIKDKCNKELSIIREQFVSRNVLENHIEKMENKLDRIHARLDELLFKQKTGA